MHDIVDDHPSSRTVKTYNSVIDRFVVLGCAPQAVKEAARLAEENAKLRYQVHHLKMSVREGDKRVAALSKA